MQKENLWQKSYECSCHGEMIMMGYEDDEKDGIPTIDLAFFNYGYSGSVLSFSNRLKWIWQILIKGTPYLDEVMLEQATAKRLGEDLIKFSQKKYAVDAVTAKIIRAECDFKIKKLREQCKHSTSTICEEQWAPGHSTGKKIKICNVCEKVLE